MKSKIKFKMETPRDRRCRPKRVTLTLARGLIREEVRGYMAILAECPKCRNRQAVKIKFCKCGANMDKAKRNKIAKYWISYRMPGGKQRTEYVGSFEGLNGYSVVDARIAEGKRKTQKRENRLLDVKEDTKTTFNELTEWYLNLEKIKALASYGTIKININKFNSVFGDMIVSHIKPADLENYQAKRLKEGMAPGTVDHEIGKPKTMINRSFDNELVSFSTWKAFNPTTQLKIV